MILKLFQIKFYFIHLLMIELYLYQPCIKGPSRPI